MVAHDKMPPSFFMLLHEKFNKFLHISFFRYICNGIMKF